MTFVNPIMYAFIFISIQLLSVSFLSKYRKGVFLLLNVLFCLLVFLPTVQTSVYSFIILILWVLSHYVSLKLMIRSSRPFVIFALWFVLNIVWFVVVKEYHWITDVFITGDSFYIWWSVIGYSFILFRQIHLSISVCGGFVKSLSLWDYLNYNLAFWTFLAGPIQRYDDFLAEMEGFTNKQVSSRDVLKGLNRIVLGLIKMALIAPFFQKYAVVTTFTQAPDVLHFILLVFAFPAYLYINFSGYCDIVIGLGRTVGFTLPENFKHPYLARNMVEFWNRWHITLSEFFRDYLFYPVFTSGTRRFNMLLSLTVATLFSFTIMGVWHGNDFRFAVFGLIHGLGVAFVTIYKEILKKNLKKKDFKSYQSNSLIKYGATLVCQCYVVFSFLVFKYTTEDLKVLFNTLKVNL